MMKNVLALSAMLAVGIAVQNVHANNAILFSGATDYISIPHSCVSSVTTQMTLEALVCPAQADMTGRIIDDIAAGGSDGFLLDLLNGAPRVIIGSTSASASGTLSANIWYHIAATYDGDSIRLYINDSVAASAASSNGVPADTYTVRLGIDRNSGNHFTGIMDEVRIWNIARAKSDIQSTMWTILSGTETGLTGYWQFNEASGTTASDLTASHNYGTLVNFAFGGTDGWVGALAGNGTDPYPYLIADYSGLKLIGASPYAVTSAYRLTAAIDASVSASENNGAGFAPICSTSTQIFSGKFHGSGHVIKNLYMNRPASSYAGLFGNSTAAIDSLGMVNCSIIAAGFVGGIVGLCAAGTISNCYVTGSISSSSASSNTFLGAIAGANQGTLSNCYSTCKLSSTSSYAGGIAGVNIGSITNSYSTGAISVPINLDEDFAGGIAGENMQTGTILSCYSTGNISGGDAGGIAGYSSSTGPISFCYSTGKDSGSLVGGIVGETNGNSIGPISHCFFTGTVSGMIAGGIAGANGNGPIIYCYSTGCIVQSGSQSSPWAGGIVGANIGTSSTVSYCYAAGSVSGPSTASIGGVVGSNTAVINNCYWNTQTSGLTNGFGQNTGTISDSGLSTAAMMSKSLFSSTFSWNFDSTWTMRNDSTYPGLRKIDNAPFAFADSFKTSRTLALTQLLLNDCDIETARQHLVLKVQSASAGTTDSVSTLTFPASFANGSVDTIRYRVGEARAATGDTLWGNIARATVTLDTTVLPLPAAVNPVFPAADDTVKTDSATLAWNRGTPSVDRYTLEYSADSLFSSSTVDSAITDTTKKITGYADNSTLYWHVKAHNVSGWGPFSKAGRFVVLLPSSIARSAGAPKTFALSIATGSWLLRYSLPKAEQVSLKLYSVNGKLQPELVNMYQKAGCYSVNMRDGRLASGTYLVVLKAEDYCQKKMVFLMK
jgi:Concanavalin A-like lectin/glucanases superfamily